MITFLPELLEKDNVRFTAYESENVIGSCLMRINENVADVYMLDYNMDKPYCVEGLIRSAYNYAALKNIYIGKCTCKNINAFLDKMNFEKKDGCYINDIPSILMGSCCGR